MDILFLMTHKENSELNCEGNSHIDSWKLGINEVATHILLFTLLCLSKQISQGKKENQPFFPPNDKIKDI